jgi:hypothetical protein
VQSFLISSTRCNAIGSIYLDNNFILTTNANACNTINHGPNSKLKNRSVIDMCPRTLHEVIRKGPKWVVERASWGSGFTNVFLTDVYMGAAARAALETVAYKAQSASNHFCVFTSNLTQNRDVVYLNYLIKGGVDWNNVEVKVGGVDALY